MNLLELPFTWRYSALTISVILALAFGALAALDLWFLVPCGVFAIVALVGFSDVIQRRHSILRNYPIAAHLRFLLEEVRPEIRQYFLESDTDGSPFNRNKRSIVYQRAKGQLDKRPFGT